MDQNNLEIATAFFLGDTSLFDKKDDDYKNLFRTYASDVNSSSIREAVTLNYLGYKQYTAKHGADGYDPITGRQKEVKPRFFTKGSAAAMGGNFNDMTLELLDKKKDFDIICSTFVNDRMICVIEFPIAAIFETLKEPIVNAKIGKRVVCQFSHTAFQHSPDLVIHLYDADFINKNNCFSKKTRILFEGKYAK